jgi:hypothetical protein
MCSALCVRNSDDQNAPSLLQFAANAAKHTQLTQRLSTHATSEVLRDEVLIKYRAGLTKRGFTSEEDRWLLAHVNVHGYSDWPVGSASLVTFLYVVVRVFL